MTFNNIYSLNYMKIIKVQLIYWSSMAPMSMLWIVMVTQRSILPLWMVSDRIHEFTIYKHFSWNGGVYSQVLKIVQICWSKAELMLCSRTILGLQHWKTHFLMVLSFYSTFYHIFYRFSFTNHECETEKLKWIWNLVFPRKGKGNLIMLLIENGANGSLTDSFGRTFLHFAAIYGE